MGDFGVAIEALYLEAPDVGGAAKNLDSVSGLCIGLVAGEVLLVGDEGVLLGPPEGSFRRVSEKYSDTMFRLREDRT